MDEFFGGGRWNMTAPNTDCKVQKADTSLGTSYNNAYTRFLLLLAHAMRSVRIASNCNCPLGNCLLRFQYMYMYTLWQEVPKVVYAFWPYSEWQVGWWEVAPTKNYQPEGQGQIHAKNQSHNSNSCNRRAQTTNQLTLLTGPKNNS